MSLCTKKTALRKCVIKAALLLIIVAALAPFMIAARYAAFHSDDFSFYNGTIEILGGSYFIKSVRRAWQVYNVWQGTYTTNLLNCLFNPLNGYSYAVLRLELIACLALSFTSTYFLCREINACFKLGDKTLLVFAIVFLPILLYTDYNEVYLWFVGAMAYQVPMMLLAFALAFMLRCKRKKRNSIQAMLVSAVLMLGMAGGVLLIGGLGACIMLIMCAADFAENRKIDKKLLLIFAAAVIGDLINALAPGNFAKRSMFGDIFVAESIAGAISSAAIEAKTMLLGNGLLAFAAAAFVVGWRSPGKNLKRITFWGVMIGMIITPAVVAFPAMLGYNATSMEYFSNRIFFVIDISIIISAETIAFLAGNRLGMCVPNANSKRGSIAAAAMIVLLMLVYSPKLVNCIPVQISENLSDRKIQIYSEQIHALFDMFQMRPGEDIVVIEQPEPCVGVMETLINSHPDSLTNMAIAKYFGNNSICDGYYAANNPQKKILKDKK